MADIAQAERMIGWMRDAGVIGTVAAIVAGLALSFLLVTAGAWIARRAGGAADQAASHRGLFRTLQGRSQPASKEQE